MKRIYTDDANTWMTEYSVGDTLTFVADTLDGVKALRKRVKVAAGELLIGMKWSRPEPRTLMIERDGTVGKWREQECWHVTARVTRRIVKDWQIKDNFPHQSESRAQLNTTTLYSVAN
jgi:hypothetical protein